MYSIRLSQKLMAATLLLGSLSAATAFADQCDYVGRHYKTDVSITAAYTYPASRSGDIVYGPSLKLTITNVGSNAITDPAAPGDIIHARRIGVNIKGTILYGFLPMPLAPGASANASFNLPDSLLATCEQTTVTLATEATLPQWGCEVFANDSHNFIARLQSRACYIDRPIIRPFDSEPLQEESRGMEVESDGNDLTVD